VNLMTVHASKGLEFPVVFVVNLAKGATGPPRPIRVIADGEGGEPSVSVGPFVSETDEAEREREKHETRRLLYVALTRARDRLYLSSVLKDGVMQPGRGSLAEVLPDSIRQLFSRAAASTDDCAPIQWTGSKGQPFEWHVCRVPAPLVTPDSSDQTAAEHAEYDSSLDRFGPSLEHQGTLRLPVTRWLVEPDAIEPSEAVMARDPIVGTLVHRLFQFLDGSPGPFEEPEFADARALLAPADRALIVDVDGTVQAAIDLWRKMRLRADVASLMASGQRLYEVPFSMRLPREAMGVDSGPEVVVLRGTIDCLVVGPDGTAVVIEFKTGRPRISHQQQLDIYVDAARLLFPGASVSGQLIYG
jgi:ATP-dependent helicase/nuclease subunit A